MSAFIFYAVDQENNPRSETKIKKVTVIENEKYRKQENERVEKCQK